MWMPVVVLQWPQESQKASKGIIQIFVKHIMFCSVVCLGIRLQLECIVWRFWRNICDQLWNLECVLICLTRYKSPCDYFLFLKMKASLHSRQYESEHKSNGSLNTVCKEICAEMHWFKWFICSVIVDVHSVSSIITMHLLCVVKTKKILKYLHLWYMHLV